MAAATAGIFFLEDLLGRESDEWNLLVGMANDDGGGGRQLPASRV